MEVARKVLSAPEMECLELYSFRAAHMKDRLYIRIDKVTCQPNNVLEVYFSSFFMG